MILTASLGFGAAATVAALLLSQYTQLTVRVAQSASVGEIVVPFGHWLLAAIWAATVTWQADDARRRAFTCVAVAFVVHLVLLIALFVPRLSDREAFSSTAYLRYAEMFCAAALALCAGAATTWARRLRQHADARVMIEAALWPPAVALAIALSRYNVTFAVIAVVSGVGIAVAFQWLRTPGPNSGTALSRIGAIAFSDRAWMAAIFVVALALRLLYITRIMTDPNYLDAGADGRVYDEVAWSIAGGNGVPQDFHDRFPLLLLGHVYLAAAVYQIAGHSYFALTAVQSILGAAACVVIFLIARMLFGRVTAIVAGSFSAVSFPLIFSAATIGHQAVDVLVTALTIWLLLRLIVAGGSHLQWAAAGAVAGFGFTVRETNVFFLAFVVIWIALAQGRSWRQSMPAVAAFVTGAAIMVLPFLAPKVWNAEARQGMRQHFDRMYRGEGGSRPSERAALVGPVEDPRGALTQLASEPGRVIGTLAREYRDNFAVQFLTQPYGGFDIVFLRKGSEYYFGMWFYAYALALAGVVLVAKQVRRGGVMASAAILILGLLVVRTIPHLMLASDYRHRAPLEPFLILLASVAVAALMREVSATAASASTSGLTGSDWRVSHSSGTWTPVT